MSLKTKYQIEYLINSGPEFLYTYISSPTGLQAWFADEVNIHGNDLFVFKWDGVEERAKLIGKRVNKYVKFQWMDRGEGEFFTFEIEQDELTGDVSLIVSDWELPENHKEARMLYDVAIEQLRQTIGG